MNAKTKVAEAPTTWQDHVAYAHRYLADAQLYPNIAKDDLEKAQFHIAKAIEAWYAKQQGEA